jgi:mRNA interferase MazF
VWQARLPVGPHPVVVVTRDVAVPVLSNLTVVLITSTIRGLRTEVPLGPEHGLDRECVVNCDNVITVPKSVLSERRGTLGPVDLRRLDDALRLALGLD